MENALATDGIICYQEEIVKLSGESYKEKLLFQRCEMTGLKGITCGIATFFQADSLREGLQFWFDQLGTEVNFQFFRETTLIEQLTGSARDIAGIGSTFSIVLAPVGSIITMNGGNSSPESPESSESMPDSLVHFDETLWEAVFEVVRRSTAGTIVCLCPDDRAAGTTSLATETEDLVRRIVASKFSAAGLMVGSHDLILPSDIQLYVSGDSVFDPQARRLLMIPYTREFFLALATAIVRKIAGKLAPPCKAIVTDCDGTLWSGVVAEEGPRGVQVTESHAALQRFLLKKKEQGIFLCLCSKNAESDITQMFQDHPDMLLSHADITASRINWRPKSENLLSLAEELHIDVNSMIMFDDNPLEAAEIAANCPQVMVIEPDFGFGRTKLFLDRLWAADHSILTDEDRRRSIWKEEDDRRLQFRDSQQSLGNFIRNLGLEISISAVTQHEIPRFSQLTMRTNQFNLSSIRRTIQECMTLVAQREVRCLAVNVRDRFGDYGLMGIMITRHHPDSSLLVVDSLLLSCRVLGRGIEHKMLRFLGQEAAQQGIARLRLDYSPTKRNQPVLDFLERVAGKVIARESGIIRFDVSVEQAIDCVFDPDRDSPRHPDSRRALESDHDEQFIENAAIITPFENRWLNLNRRIAQDFHDPSRLYAAFLEWGSLRVENTDSSASANASSHEGLEGIIWNAWLEILNVRNLAVDQNLFELGADSLSITRCISVVYEKCGLEMEFGDFFLAPTVAGLTARLQNRSDETSIDEPLSTLSSITSAPHRSHPDNLSLREDSSISGTSPETAIKSTITISWSDDPAPPRGDDQHISTFGVVTRDHPESTCRCLRSFISNFRTHGHSARLLVVDDSPAIRTRNDYLASLAALASEEGVVIHYAGLDEKAAFIDLLSSRSNLPRDLVNFALLGDDKASWSAGSNRNSLMLMTAGELLFSTDDDIIGRPSFPPESGEGIVFSDEHEPSGFWFFPDREAALAAIRPGDVDILSAHNEFLGKPLSDFTVPGWSLGESSGVVGKSPASEDTENVERIVITTNGLVGDSGINAPFGLIGFPDGVLTIGGRTHNHLVINEHLYRQACSTREVIKSVERPTLSRGSFFSSFCFGLDNRFLLPPALPVLRAEDRFFGFMIRFTQQHLYTFSLPWVLSHFPVKQRRGWPEGIFLSARSIAFVNILVEAMFHVSHQSGGLSGEAFLKSYGEFLVELASLPEQKFRDHLRSLLQQGVSRFSVSLEQIFENHPNAPQFWKNDLRHFEKLMITAAMTQDYVIPTDIIAIARGSDPLSLTRDFMLRIGELMIHWPVLRETANVLCRQGLTPGIEIR